MMSQQISPVPPSYNISKNIALSVRILKEGNRYEISLQTDWSTCHRFFIEPTQQDVEELNIGLQQAIEQVSLKFGKAGYREAISNLAKKGNNAFKWIFKDEQLRGRISKVLRAGAAIEFSCEDFFIPWELLYDGPLGSEIDMNCFWGMRNVVARALVQRDSFSDLSDLDLPVIQLTRPKVGLISNNELKYVAKEEVATLRELDAHKQIALEQLRPLSPSQYYDELEWFGRFLRDESLHIVHLACHACTKKPVSHSYLRVSDRFNITVEDFREFKVADHPLVILNACVTGTMDPLYTSNWGVLFWKNGARGVIATEFYVPDWFAAAFIKELYKNVLSDMSAGQAILATRRSFWEEQQNPLGLAYALYARSFIGVVHCGPSKP